MYFFEKMKRNIYILIAYILTVVLLLLYVLLFVLMNYFQSKRTDQRWVYQKEIIYENAPIYRLYIRNEMKSNGNVSEKSNFFNVSKEIYLLYSVGDWFDSQDPWEPSAEVNDESRIESAN